MLSHLADILFGDIVSVSIDWKVDCIHLSSDSNQWRALVSTVTNFCVPLNARNFWSG
jgi:hypothetical protein